MSPKTLKADESEVSRQGRGSYLLTLDKPNQPPPLATLHSPSSATGGDALASRA